MYQKLLQLLYGGNSPYDGFPVQHWPNHYIAWNAEHHWFSDLVERLRPELIIEVGTFLGGSAMHMARTARHCGISTTVLCIDTWLGDWMHWVHDYPVLRHRFGRPSLYEHFMANVIRNKLTTSILPLAMDSANAARFLNHHHIMAELVYIDGSHDAGEVIRDLEFYWPLLVSGGCLMIDDLTIHAGVKTDWDMFLGKYNLEQQTDGEKGIVFK